MDLFGLSSSRLGPRPDTDVERVIVQRPLQRVMAFLGCSIDQVCNDRITKNQVAGFYKLYKQVNRSSEISELEAQWNSTGIRY